eukprot:UN01207
MHVTKDKNKIIKITTKIILAIILIIILNLIGVKFLFKKLHLPKYIYVNPLILPIILEIVTKKTTYPSRQGCFQFL